MAAESVGATVEAISPMIVADFAFQLQKREVKAMRSQNATASKRNARYRSWAFTESRTRI